MKEQLTTQIRADFDKSFTTGGAGVRCSALAYGMVFTVYNFTSMEYIRMYICTSVAYDLK